MLQRTFGRGFVQPGNVKNPGAALALFEVLSGIRDPGLSRPRVLYIPWIVSNAERLRRYVNAR